MTGWVQSSPRPPASHGEKPVITAKPEKNFMWSVERGYLYGRRLIGDKAVVSVWLRHPWIRRPECPAPPPPPPPLPPPPPPLARAVVSSDRPPSSRSCFPEAAHPSPVPHDQGAVSSRYSSPAANDPRPVSSGGVWDTRSGESKRMVARSRRRREGCCITCANFFGRGRWITISSNKNQPAVAASKA